MFFRSGLEELSYEANWKAFALKCVTWTKLGFTDKMYLSCYTGKSRKAERLKAAFENLLETLPSTLGSSDRLNSTSLRSINPSVVTLF